MSPNYEALIALVTRSSERGDITPESARNHNSEIIRRMIITEIPIPTSYDVYESSTKKNGDLNLTVVNHVHQQQHNTDRLIEIGVMYLAAT